MGADLLAERVVEQARALVESEGGNLRLLGVERNVARVGYLLGRNDECPECVLAPEDLHGFLLEMFARGAPHITAVEVVVEQPAVA
jgi:hypothetical protein